MTLTRVGSARNRSSGVDYITFCLWLKPSAALGEEYYKILLVHGSSFMVVLDCLWYLVSLRDAHKEGAVFVPACEVSVDILS